MNSRNLLIGASLLIGTSCQVAPLMQPKTVQKPIQEAPSPAKTEPSPLEIFQDLKKQTDNIREDLSYTDMGTLAKCIEENRACIDQTEEMHEIMMKGETFPTCEDIEDPTKKSSCQETELIKRGKIGELISVYKKTVPCFQKVTTCADASIKEGKKIEAITKNPSLQKENQKLKDTKEQNTKLEGQIPSRGDKFFCDHQTRTNFDNSESVLQKFEQNPTVQAYRDYIHAAITYYSAQNECLLDRIQSAEQDPEIKKLASQIRELIAQAQQIVDKNKYVAKAKPKIDLEDNLYCTEEDNAYDIFERAVDAYIKAPTPKNRKSYMQADLQRRKKALNCLKNPQQSGISTF